MNELFSRIESAIYQTALFGVILSLGMLIAQYQPAIISPERMMLVTTAPLALMVVIKMILLLVSNKTPDGKDALLVDVQNNWHLFSADEQDAIGEILEEQARRDQQRSKR